MPASGWNGKLQVVGNGGFAGTIGYRAHGHGAGRRLRGREHRYRPHWTGRQHVRHRRCDARFRLPRHPRDRRGGEAGRGRLLRGGTEVRLLQRLFDWRAPGADGGAALSRRLHRHRRRRARDLHHEAGVRAAVVLPGDCGRRRRDPEGDAAADSRRRARGVRRARRRQGRRAREPARVHVRPWRAGVQAGRRAAVMPDRAAGRIGPEDLRRRLARRRPARRSSRASSAAASWAGRRCR